MLTLQTALENKTWPAGTVGMTFVKIESLVHRSLVCNHRRQEFIKVKIPWYEKRYRDFVLIYSIQKWRATHRRRKLLQLHTSQTPRNSFTSGVRRTRVYTTKLKYYMDNMNSILNYLCFSMKNFCKYIKFCFGPSLVIVSKLAKELYMN